MSVIIESIATSLPTFFADKAYSQVAVIVDENTKEHCYPVVQSLLPEHILIEIKSGETNKNLGTCTHIWQALTNASFDRHGLVLNLGGGVIGDMGGFCAATYKRGIDFVQVPTTLLAQVDASVGGKLGVDFNDYKNHIGVFKQPEAVLIDTIFYKTLPHAELKSGFAEVIKHCLIRDEAMWEKIRKREFEEQDWNELVKHSVAIKKEIVAEDPTEKGLRKILNFGHTLGHAVETHFLHKPGERLLHGEAIAVGMLMESFIAFKRNMINIETLSQIEEFVFSEYGKVHIADDEIVDILKHTKQDKKNRGADVRFSLLDAAGSCTYDVVCNEEEMTEAFAYYMA